MNCAVVEGFSFLKAFILPLVNKIMNEGKLVKESDSFSDEQKEEFYFILISLIKVYGNKEWS